MNISCKIYLSRCEIGVYLFSITRRSKLFLVSPESKEVRQQLAKLLFPCLGTDACNLFAVYRFKWQILPLYRSSRPYWPLDLTYAPKTEAWDQE